MTASLRAIYVISWSQTETDGIPAAPQAQLEIGALWRWSGTAVRVDGPAGLLFLDGAEGGADLRRRAARMVQRLIGVATGDAEALAAPAENEDAGEDFVLSDGTHRFGATILNVPDSNSRLIMFTGAMPPADCDLWVVRCRFGDWPEEGHDPAGVDLSGEGRVICFVSGTPILTPSGYRPIESLQPGDRVQSIDNGACQIVWTGRRHLSGARLFALPELRPIRFRGTGPGQGPEGGDLLVSPGHRMLKRGRVAQDLFNSDEVLVAAADLVDGQAVQVDNRLPAVTYHHLLLEAHEVIFANGLECESFHPAGTSLATLDPGDRRRLEALLPGAKIDPSRYGAFARRCLKRSEAVLLRHGRAAQGLLRFG